MARSAAARLLLIDNVDSFTFMLADTLRQVGADVTVTRRTEVSLAKAMSGPFDGVVISPGPGHPQDAELSLTIAAACVETRRPLLGVCLGHQALAIACGGQVGRTAPVHGKLCTVRHDASGLFAGLPNSFDATRYHSLAVTRLPAELAENAWSEDAVIMAMRHRDAPAHGLQFHPESIGTRQGRALLANFAELAGRHA